MRPRQRPGNLISGASTGSVARSVAIATVAGLFAAAAILGACTSDGGESPSPSATLARPSPLRSGLAMW